MCCMPYYFVFVCFLFVCLFHLRHAGTNMLCMFLFSAVFIILGPIIYATDVKNDFNFSGSDLHAGFFLVIIASVLCVVCAVMAFFVP